jgi:AraC-like DNA-binding protein
MTEPYNADQPGTTGDFEWWSGVVNALIPTVLSRPDAAAFRAVARSVDLGILRASVTGAPPVRSARTTATIRRCDPELWQVLLITGGRAGLAQHRNHALLAADQLAIFDTSHPYEFEVLAGRASTAVMVHLPRTLLPVPDRALRAMAAQPLPGRSGIGTVLRRLLYELAAPLPAAGTPAGDHLGPAVLHLTAAWLADLAGTRDLLPAESRQDALRRAVRSFIERHLADTELSPRTVAEAHHISVSHLHHLFHDHGQTVTGLIRRQRLERCKRELADRTVPVGSIGARWGFPDPATFSRTFKAAYGLPPGEYRRQSCGSTATRRDRTA